MGAVVYSLCAATALACSALLLRAYARNGVRLLLWSGLCFAGLTVNNALLAVDLLIFPEIDLFALRNLAALVAVSLLLYGLLWESE
ncbi:MAG TPA: DUF5985 family protein [Candidatus Limnocylindrales bacterium]|nr:DUF5985 family protein [Candidatus Limnocylindrales bacterium]